MTRITQIIFLRNRRQEGGIGSGENYSLFPNFLFPPSLAVGLCSLFPVPYSLFPDPASYVTISLDFGIEI